MQDGGVRVELFLSAIRVALGDECYKDLVPTTVVSSNCEWLISVLAHYETLQDLKLAHFGRDWTVFEITQRLPT